MNDYKTTLINTIKKYKVNENLNKIKKGVFMALKIKISIIGLLAMSCLKKVCVRVS